MYLLILMKPTGHHLRYGVEQHLHAAIITRVRVLPSDEPTGPPPRFVADARG